MEYPQEPRTTVRGWVADGAQQVEGPWTQVRKAAAARSSGYTTILPVYLHHCRSLSLCVPIPVYLHPYVSPSLCASIPMSIHCLIFYKIEQFPNLLKGQISPSSCEADPFVSMRSVGDSP